MHLCWWPYSPPSSIALHQFTKFKQQSLPYFVSSQCISTNWNVMFKNLLESKSDIYSANNFVLSFPDFYSYDQLSELQMCLLQEHHCTLMFSHNLLLKMPSFFTILLINLKLKIFTLRPKRVGHQQILCTHCAVSHYNRLAKCASIV